MDLYLLLILMMMPILAVSQTQGGCIEEEKTTLLEIKTSLVDSYVLDVDHFLPSWVDDGGECCDWERVKCNTSTGHVIDLSLSNVMDGCEMILPLNVSLFLHFKQLTSLNLSFDCLDDNIVSTGLASMKKLEILDLRWNFITNEIFPSLGALTSLRVLYLGDNELKGYFNCSWHVFALENLEFLDLTNRDFSYSHPTNQIQGFEQVFLLKKLRILSLGYNEVNESLVTSLRVLPSLKTLDLRGNTRFGSFPAEELSLLPNLEFLLLGSCGFNGTLLPLEALASFHHLVSLDLSFNNFVGSIPSTIHALSSLRELSFAYNMLNGSLPDNGLCELKNLHELDLSGNMFDGSLPQCLNRLSSLKLLDISVNQFTGILPSSLIANLTSLQYVDFSYNDFEGLFSFSAFSNHTKLEVVRFISENDNFEVETIEPIGWIPRFQLKLLALPSCNINRAKGSVFPEFLFHQRMLWILDLSHNSLVGQVPNWLIENNTMLKLLNLRNNSFDGTICMSLHSDASTTWLDMSENHINGTIPSEIQKFLPNLFYLNLSRNSLDGSIPISVGDMNRLWALDLSDNKLSGEVPKGLLTNKSSLNILKLSKNKLHGEVLSDNLTFGDMRWLALDNNFFTGNIGNGVRVKSYLRILDISNNFLTGTIPSWIGNISKSFELVVRNNNLEGQFPCGKTSFSFLDISQNSFSGPIPSCLNWEKMKHLHLGSNSFTGSIPNVFSNLTHILTLDIGNNNLSGRIPKFLGRLSNLRILILRKNNFSGYIPKQLCRLSNVSLIDLSGNSLSGSIPPCLQNIISPINHVFIEGEVEDNDVPFGNYQSVLFKGFSLYSMMEVLEIQDEVQFTIKTHSRTFKGHLLDLMVGLDLSCNNLVGEIPKELGLLTQIHSLNLSHNQLTGTIPEQLSNLENIESFDVSYNGLRGEVPSSLIKLNSLAIFNVSYNNLSGRLPDMKAQFSTFTKESYEGNPLLCGPPLERKCKSTSQVTDSSTKEVLDKWYDIDMTSFYGSFGSTWAMLLLGFVAVLYINPYWRRRWLDLVEECMYACYYFLDDSVRKSSKFFRK